MATNNVLTVTGDCISFANHAGDFSPTAAYVLEHGTPLDVELVLASLAANAAANSAKFDFAAGGTGWAEEWSIASCLEVASAAAVVGEVVELYMAYSTQSGATIGNSGGADGSAGAYAGTSASTMDNSLGQLRFIGRHYATLDDTADSPEVQICNCGTFRPEARYGQLIVVNKLTGAFHANDIEMNIVFTPLIPQIQADV